MFSLTSTTLLHTDYSTSYFTDIHTEVTRCDNFPPMGYTGDITPEPMVVVNGVD